MLIFVLMRTRRFVVAGSTEDEQSDADPRHDLLRAAEVGDVEACKRILAAEPDKLHLADAEGYTPLHRACYNDRIEVAKV
jgi:ankyrin repeat protein